VTAITEAAEDGMVAVTDDGRPISPRVSAYFQAAGRKDVTVPVDRAVAAQRGCKHWMPGQKYGTPDQCHDCPAMRGGGGQVAVPQATEPAQTAAGTVATREPGSIPGDKLLDLIRDKWFGKYATFPTQAALDAVTLWTAHAHMRDADGILVFDATPRLYLLSSEPGSGKSHVLELIGMITPACHGLDLEPTAAGLAHSIAKEHATILLDEGDVLFGTGARKSAVRAIINGGYTRHGTVLNGQGAKASRVPVYGALAMAALDTVEKGANAGTLAALFTRGIKIRMVKASGADAPAKMTRTSKTEAVKARAWLEAWAAEVRDEVADAQPAMPEGVEGRAEQIWTALIAVADAAGGSWPERARAACTELALAVPVPEDDDGTIGEQFAAFAASFGED
jgi:Protein of unknown function (DUF3631)